MSGIGNLENCKSVHHVDPVSAPASFSFGSHFPMIPKQLNLVNIMGKKEYIFYSQIKVFASEQQVQLRIVASEKEILKFNFQLIWDTKETNTESFQRGIFSSFMTVIFLNFSPSHCLSITPAQVFSLVSL